MIRREYPAHVRANHDGDTLTVDVDLGFHVELAATPLRLAGVNCPELPTPAGLAAQAYTRQWLLDHPAPWTLIQVGDGRDKYGRLLGCLRAADGRVLNDDLLGAKQAAPMKQ